MWASTCPNPGIVACETGHGKGLLTLADQSHDYVEPETMEEFESVANGIVFKDKDTIVFDSLSYFAKTYIKRKALSMPRKYGETLKRKSGVPELDDYGVIGELTAEYTERLLKIPKHVVVLATERYDGGNEDKPELLIGPAFAGSMFAGSTAMFDFVLRLRTRPKLKDPKDAKSRYTERYFITEADGKGTIAKCRPSGMGKGLLAPEEVFNLETGEGTFPAMMKKILDAYAKPSSSTP